MRARQNALLLRQFAALSVTPDGRQPMRRGRWTAVSEGEQGLLFRHGRLTAVLGAGRHRRWANGYSVRTVDLRPWLIALPTQEVPTSDGVSVKVTLAARARVVDAALSVTAARDTDQLLYLAVQVALREVLATTSIEDLLAARGQLGSRVLTEVRGLETIGVVVEQLELKDIVLPADLRKAQADVLVARAQAASALERARGETAALRSLANAARLAADNPALLQLRLLQQLDVSTGHTVVVNAAPLASAAVPGTPG
jgi:regulator of protease activity HflC (stomatin/prohibitin superfamily)